MNAAEVFARLGWISLGACAFWFCHCLLWHHFDEILGPILLIGVAGPLIWMAESE